MCYRIHYVFFLKHSIHMCPCNISRFLTCIQCLLCHICGFFFLLCCSLVAFHIHTCSTHIKKMLYTFFLAKTFAMRCFLYVDIPSYSYFAYLAFNVHASTFSYNNTFITFEIPINVSSRFKENSSSTTYVVQ